MTYADSNYDYEAFSDADSQTDADAERPLA